MESADIVETVLSDTNKIAFSIAQQKKAAFQRLFDYL